MIIIKEKFIKSTIILIIGGLLIKALGMLIRIVITRLVGLDGIGLYMLIFPTFSLCMTLAEISLPIAISKIVSADKHNNKKIVLGIIPITLFFNLFLIIIITFLAKPIAINLLNNELAYYPILSIGLALPMDAIASILRGYFFGKMKMLPHILSLLCEQLVRLVLIIIFVPYLLPFGVTFAVSFVILVNIFSEGLSIFVLFFFLPKNIVIKKSDFIIKLTYIKDIFSIAIPTTLGRLISSISYFLEPIILVYFLSKNYSLNFITTEYGIISGYVMPMLLMPSFISGAISSALLPIISKGYANNNKKYIISKLKLSCLISFVIGLFISVILFINPFIFLKLLYNTHHGGLYLRLMAIPFLLFYIEAPLSSFLQGCNKSNLMMKDSFLGVIIKNIILVILCNFKLGLLPLIISTSIGIIITTTSHIINIKKVLKSI
ncbi:MAG: oligosaccharide flippase family protein [Bacilli bacterium]